MPLSDLAALAAPAPVLVQLAAHAAMRVAGAGEALGSAVPVEPGGRRLIRFAEVCGQLLLTGSALIAAYVVPRAVAAVGAETVVARVVTARARRVVGVLGILLLVTTATKLLLDSASAAGVPLLEGSHGAHLWAVLTEPAEPGSWIGPGAVSLLTLVAGGATALLSVLVLRSPGGALAGRAVVAVAALAVVVVVVPALPTTLTGVDAKGYLDPFATQLHVFAGSVWVGGLVLAALLLRRPATDAVLRAQEARFWPRFWQGFSAAAVLALGLVVVSGSYLVWTHVGSVTQLLTTPYGVAVTVKVCVVAVMTALGAINQVHLIPGINRARAAGATDTVVRIALRDFRGTVAVEAVLGLVVIGVVPFLTGSARRQAAEATGGEASPAVLDAGILGLAVLGVAVMVALFWASTRVAAVRSRPDVGSEPERQLQL